MVRGRRNRWLGGGVGVVLATAGVAAPASAFTNYELGAQPLGVPGQTCPAAGSTCWNNAAEPAIRVDPAGNFYGGSENGLGAGTDAWKSPRAANGAHFTYLGEPDGGTSQTSTHGFAPGGGDVDLATATAKNSAGFYNVYVASLSLANIDVSTSRDGGRTFTLNPVGAHIAGDDREWIAADGASKVCISYHDVATSNIDVDCSTNGGTTFLQPSTAIDASHLYLLQNNELGNLAIDPRTHYIYQVIAGIGSGDVSCSTQGTCGYHVLYMAVSTDGGKTFTDHQIYSGPSTKSYNHNFPNVSVDRGGNVYAVWSDNRLVRYSYSTTHGSSWHGPYTISRTPANTAIYPWSTAGLPGHLAVVYYGSSYSSSTASPDNFPASATWYAYYAENDTVLTAPTSFAQSVATPVVHAGAVCEGGISCTGNRDLYDDFGVAVSPVTDRAVVIYSDDRYGQANQPPPSGCTAATTNSASCDHTSVAYGASRLFATTTATANLRRGRRLHRTR